jgi:hypothetical protein
MNQFFRLKYALIFALGFSLITGAIHAQGKASGKLVLDGKTYNLTHSMATTEENVFEKDKKDVVILITDQAVKETDEQALNEMAEAGKIHGIRVSLDPEKRPYVLVVLGAIHVSGSGFMEFQPTQFTNERVAGTISKASDESMGHKYEFNVQFDTPITDAFAAAKAAEEAGTPLPAGGGDPGKAYFEYDKAVRAGDIAKMKAFAADEEMAKQLDDPQAKEMIAMIKEMRAKQIKILKGTINGDNAILYVEGVSGMGGGKTTGKVQMVKKNNAWKLIKESWSN